MLVQTRSNTEGEATRGGVYSKACSLTAVINTLTSNAQIQHVPWRPKAQYSVAASIALSGRLSRCAVSSILVVGRVPRVSIGVVRAVALRVVRPRVKLH